MIEQEVEIKPSGLRAILRIPDESVGIVAFAHGSGSSRLSPRNNAVAEALGRKGLATLLSDLLTPSEEERRDNVFDIALLSARLAEVIAWIDRNETLAPLPLGLFGASTGAAAALVTATHLPDRVAAVVSRGGRPDLAGESLRFVRAPTLLIVGGADYGVIELNEEALAQLPGEKALQIVPGASHLFPEPGALEVVIDHTAVWFLRYLAKAE